MNPSPADRDRMAYQLGREFLLSLREIDAGITTEVIASYLKSETAYGARPNNLPEIYRRILFSAQTANMKPSVIGTAIGGFDNLRKVTFDFDHERVLAFYGDDCGRVLSSVKAKLNPNSKRAELGQIWHTFCRTILSAARFTAQFRSAREFYAWASIFDRDPKTRMGLPLIMEREIDGVGLALACDFLKELGFEGFPKPDVHLQAIFIGLGLCAPEADSYELCKAIVRLAANAEVTAYNADKVFWMIGSGTFDNHKGIGKNGRLPGKHRDRFIRWARRELPKRLKAMG